MVLKGIRVLAPSTLIAGPYCAMILGAMGAEVIKIEHPTGGDPARAMGPPYVKGQSAITLSKDRPDLVYCSVTGFGERGPYRMKAGTDTIFQGMGGVMTVSGEPGDPPLRLGVPIADVSTGIYAALGVMMALSHRAQTGRGQKIEISLLDSLIALQTP